MSIRSIKIIGIFLIILLGAMNIAVDASTMSNSGGGIWKYQRDISIKENSGTALTDYQVLIELNGADFPGEAKSNGDDIRFIDSSGNELNYWIENWNYAGKNAKIWVKIPNIAAGSSIVIRMHYGNPDASGISNGNKVFDFFDDFEYSDSVTNHGWGNTDTRCVLQTTSTDWATSGTRSMKIVHTIDVVCGIIRQIPIPTPFLITYDAKQTQTSTATILVSSATASDWFAGNADGSMLPYIFTVFTKYGYTNPVTYTGSYNYPAIWMGQSTSHSSATAYIDNFRVRKYASSEPTVIISQPKSSSLTITKSARSGTNPGQNASVNLYGEKTDVVLGENVLLKLSAINIIGNPIMHVQVIIIPPNGWSVASSEFSKSGAGQYVTMYDLKPEDGSRDIEVRIMPNQIGDDFEVNGRIIYYFGDDLSTREDQTLSMPIKVRTELKDTPPKSPGFEGIIGIVGLLFVIVLIKRSGSLK